MRDLTGIELQHDDFDALRALCRADPRFPANWPAWLRLMRIAVTDAVSAGHVPGALVLKPQHFESWCERVAIVPCVDALRAYAIVQRSEWASGMLPSPARLTTPPDPVEPFSSRG